MSLQSPYARLVAMVGCKLLIKLFRECVILNEVKDPSLGLGDSHRTLRDFSLRSK